MLLLTQSFTSLEAQVSRHGTDFVHPNMFHLAVIAATLTCTEAHQLVNKMNEFRVEEETRTEMIQIVKEETPNCWDANVD